MGVLIANNAASRLASSLSTSATAFSVTAGDGAKFPSPSNGDWFPVTVIKSSGALEIMKCTGRSGDVLTVVRAQESTAASAFSVGDRVELRLTAAAIKVINDTADAAVKRSGDTMTGTLVVPTLVASATEVGSSAAGGYLDVHQTGGNADYDVRITADQAVSGTTGGGRLNVGAQKGIYCNGQIFSDGVVAASGGATYMEGNGLVVKGIGGANAHLWLRNENGTTRAVIYADASKNVFISDGTVVRAQFNADGYSLFKGIVGNQLEVVGAATTVLEKNNPAPGPSMFSAGSIELRTRDGSYPAIGFHRAGFDAAALYFNGSNFQRVSHVGTVLEMIDSANLTAWISNNINGDVQGAVVFARNNTGADVAFGGLIAGVNLSPANTGSYAGQLSGTYRCLGRGSAGSHTNWIKVS